MTILRDIADFIALMAAAIFALGAVCGGGAVMIAVNLFGKWNRAKS